MIGLLKNISDQVMVRQTGFRGVSDLFVRDDSAFGTMDKFSVRVGIDNALFQHESKQGQYDFLFEKSLTT